MSVFIPIATICLFLFNSFFVGVMPVIFDGQKLDISQLNFSNFVRPYEVQAKDSGSVLGVIEIATPPSNNSKLTKEADIVDSLSPQISSIDINKPEVDKNKLPQPIKKTELNLSAQSAIAYDCEGNQLLYDQEGDKPSAIASITKLFTALVFIENNPGWDSVYQMKTSDRREGGRINLFTGEKVLIKDLFYTSLVASDNTATIALVNSIGITEEEFVKLMNLKAQQLNLKQTKFNDPVGLSNQNISTAREVAIFTREALSNKEIRQASVTKKYQFKTKEGRNKVVYNTDDLLDSLPKNSIRILGGKTGFIDAAGYCFVGQFTNSQGKEIVTVVLGSKSDKERFSQTVKLADWVYQSQIW